MWLKPFGSKKHYLSSVFRDRVCKRVKAETGDAQSLCDRKQSCDLLDSPPSERTDFTATELAAQRGPARCSCVR